jgi:hypothetical protein
MRRSFLTVLAVAILVSNGIILHRAAAMSLAAPSALGVATAGSELVQKATAVCGINGCVAVQVKRLDKHQLHKTIPQTQQQILPRPAS